MTIEFRYMSSLNVHGEIKTVYVDGQRQFDTDYMYSGHEHGWSPVYRRGLVFKTEEEVQAWIIQKLVEEKLS